MVKARLPTGSTGSDRLGGGLNGTGARPGETVGSFLQCTAEGDSDQALVIDGKIQFGRDLGRAVVTLDHSNTSRITTHRAPDGASNTQIVKTMAFTIEFYSERAHREPHFQRDLGGVPNHTIPLCCF